MSGSYVITTQTLIRHTYQGFSGPTYLDLEPVERHIDANEVDIHIDNGTLTITHLSSGNRMIYMPDAWDSIRYIKN